uniref:Uncharacterized protein n=1 Tax=Rhizophora mucronata TaxID=61149 RepID=A0A2P2LLP0_RHIMU
MKRLQLFLTRRLHYIEKIYVTSIHACWTNISSHL